MKQTDLLRKSKNGRIIKVNVPSADYFVNMIKNKKHFVYTKCNHGFWDGLRGIKYDINSSPSEIATVCTAHKRRSFYRKIDETLYYKQTKLWVDAFHNYDTYPDNFHVGLSLTNGISAMAMNEHSYMAAVRLTSNSKRSFYHGGLIRHYSVDDSMKKIFNAIDNSDVNVHLIAPDYCKIYSSLFKDKINHIKVSYMSGANKIESILETLKATSKKNDIVFCSFGQSEIFIADYCLKNNISLFCIGRAFDWFFKGTGNKAIDNQQWLRGNVNRNVNAVKRFNAKVNRENE